MHVKLFLLSLSFCVIGKVYAQIEGGVTDKNEQPMANVTITARDSSGKVIEIVKSSEQGFFEFVRLKKGKYKIEAATAGYHAILENIIVTRESVPANPKKDISSATRLDIILEPDK